MLDDRVQRDALHVLALESADGGYHLAKRVFDTVAASMALLLLSPVLVIAAIAVKLDSSGPVIFRQERIGVRRVSRNGTRRWEAETFTFYKFRTMHDGSSSKLHEQYIAAYINGDLSEMHSAAGDAGAPETYKLVNDPRVTRVGRILRRLSIDELPQLWNVVKGNMSLVGPRPAIPYEVAMYEQRHFRRLAAKPGITGLWQVSGRSRIGFEDMVELDCEYIRQRSLRFDTSLLVRTLPVVLSMRGAG